MGNTLLHAYGGASEPVVQVHNAGALPNTGFDLTTFVVLGVLLLAAGALTWYAGRPR